MIWLAAWNKKLRYDLWLKAMKEKGDYWENEKL